MIAIHSVTKSYNNHPVLKNLDLEIPEGIIFGLLGPNGAGKTTLLRLIMGRLRPDAGSIRLFGKYQPGDEEACFLLGYMPQQAALYEGLSVEENILFFGRLYRVPEQELRLRLDDVLQRVELTGKREALAGNLSGGQKQRVMLATAMIHRPRLLILDEPTAGVDPMLRISFWNWFEAMARDGTSILVTTHHISEAARCTEVVFLREGLLLDRGSPGQLTARYGVKDLEAAFVQATYSETSTRLNNDNDHDNNGNSNRDNQAPGPGSSSGQEPPP